jgi:hypothetical protein
MNKTKSKTKFSSLVAKYPLLKHTEPQFSDPVTGAPKQKTAMEFDSEQRLQRLREVELEQQILMHVSSRNKVCVEGRGPIPTRFPRRPNEEVHE